MKGLYAIRDRLAGELIGIVMMFSAPAAAVRWFGDVLSNAETLPGKHPKDFELCKYGQYTSEDDQIDGHEREVVMTGALWLAAQQADAAQVPLELERREA